MLVMKHYATIAIKVYGCTVIYYPKNVTMDAYAYDGTNIDQVRSYADIIDYF